MTKRTDKHLLKLDFNTHPTETQTLLDVMLAYQKQKNTFSDALNSCHWNQNINLLQGFDFRTIRDSLKQHGFETPYAGLTARLWRMALNEAYDLHYRTYSTQVEVVKESIHYHLFYKSPVWKSFKDDEKNLFDNFIHLTNSLFYNFQTFTELEKCLFSYKFKKHKIGKTSISYIENFKRFLMNISLKNKKIKETVENILFESNSQWLKRYVYLIVKKIKKHYHQTNQIVSQINPTILLDKESYNLYSENGKNYIEITSLIFRKRIKIELSGYKGSLPKAKNRTSNICVSFNPIEAQFYVHFTFEDKKAQNKKENINTKKDDESFLGADYGESELLTLSDKKVIGNEQGKLLRQIIKETQKALKSVQLGTVDDLFFGIERKNTGRRNNKNNAFNHHKGKENINHHYRHHQQKINRRTEQYLLKCLHELEAHCKKNHISELVVEKLNFSQLGKNKIQRATINLIKGFYGLVNKKSFIKLTHVNPAYTSQTCPCCGYVNKENRAGDSFCCLECNYIPNVRNENGYILCSEADYIGAINIANRRHEPLIGMSQAEVKELLLKRFNENKKDKFQLNSNI